MSKRGETKEKLLETASEVFFQHGYEGASVRMILDKAGIVTGSFYHFFSSKEDLFEAVTERFLQSYTDRVCSLFFQADLPFDEMIRQIIEEMEQAVQTYYRVLQSDRLHWSVQLALHQRALQKMIPALAGALKERSHRLEYSLDTDPQMLAGLIVRGIETILHADHSVSVHEKIPLILDYIHLLVREKQEDAASPKELNTLYDC